MYRVSGKILKGLGYGRILGFPTANLDRREYILKRMNIPEGVYAGTAEIEGVNNKRFKAGIVIGLKDTKKFPKIEAHLLDFKGVLYGKKVKLFFRIPLHPFKAFKSESALKKQIGKDMEAVRRRISL